jgi:hypothetical protein
MIRRCFSASIGSAFRTCTRGDHGPPECPASRGKVPSRRLRKHRLPHCRDLAEGLDLMLCWRSGFGVDRLSIGLAGMSLPIAGKRTAASMHHLMLQHLHGQVGKLGAAHRALVGRRLAPGIQRCHGAPRAHRPQSCGAPRPAERAQLVEFDVDVAGIGSRHGQPGRASLPGKPGAPGGLALMSGSTRWEVSPQSDR